MKVIKTGKKYQVRRGIALVLSFILIVSLWQAEVRATTDEFGETVVSLFGTTFVIQEDGSLWTWGGNGSGQLGDGSTDNRAYPVKIMEQVVTAALGEGVAFALKADSSLWAWGYNSAGQLGIGTTTDARTPQKVLEDVREIVIGESSTYALKEDGSLWSWGWNDAGQLGDGTTVDRSYPAKVMDDIRQVITRDKSVYAIDAYDDLWVWGENSNHQLGIGSSNYVNPNPQKILDNVQSVQANYNSAYALKGDGSLWAWGNEVVAGAVMMNYPTPQKVMDNVSQFAADSGGVYAIKDDGNLWTWNHPQSLFPASTMMSGENQLLPDVEEIMVSKGQSAYAKKTDGSLWSWGRNDDGQLGDGSFMSRAVPAKVMDDVWRYVVSDANVYVIKNDDSLWAWGQNRYYGQLGIGTTFDQGSPQKVTDEVKNVFFSSDSVFALLNDNSLWSWGNNGSGQLGIGKLDSQQLTPHKVIEKVAIPGDTMISNEPLVVTPKPLSTALEAIVRQQIGKLSGDLTDTDWSKLTRLDLTSAYLQDLGGLEKARNLQELDLSFAQIDDIMTLALLPNLRVVILKNSKLPDDQLALLKRKLSGVKFRIMNISISDNQVRLWNTNQTGDTLTRAAEEIIENAGRQQLGSSNGLFVINKANAKNGAQKAEAVKDQLYAKATFEGKELNKELETIVKFSLAASAQPLTKIRIDKGVSQLPEVDRLIIEVNPEVSLEMNSEQLQAAGDLEIEIEEVKAGARINLMAGEALGGNAKKSKTYKVKMKKGKKTSKVGLSMKTDDDPYNVICRKGANGEEIIGGKYDKKTKKMSAKIGDDGEYYVRKNEKNFTDIEGLPTKQKEMIKILASKGILQGNSIGQFMPNQTITRSEILTVLVRLSYAYDNSAVSNFYDVAKNAWYYPYISSGAEIGVVNGYPDNSFKPNNVVGAAEMAKMNAMMLVYKKGYRFPKEVQKYLAKLAQNSNIPAWAVAYIAMGEREGFLLKAASGFYDGTQMMTRQQAAEMLYRLYEKL
ncbi:hypothetical protein EII17_04560 [Clostridiales bacterium COT073_COT-073]|nr:hypothetical protein EII17_04560 [Clostridiales bacterium COT073_COT-073]